MILTLFNLLRVIYVVFASGTIISAIKIFIYGERNKKLHRIEFAKNLTSALQRMGPSFIKLGQFLSTRPDLIGDDVSDSLSLLQDKLPPFSKKSMIKILKNELGKPIHECYQEIDYTPIAAASIAQVHKAITLEGEVVAVKILRPNIENQFHKDLKLFFMMAKFIDLIFPSLRRLQLVSAVKTMAKSVEIELDLRMEAASADQLFCNIADDLNIYIPKVYWNLTTKRVCTLEWIDGIPINDKKSLINAGINIDDIIKKLAISFFNQAFKYGFFHADLHPGNILVKRDGTISFIDFGIMGHLDKKNKLFIAHMLHSFIKRDYKKVSDLHFEIGYIPQNESREYFALACRSIGEPIIGVDANKISIGLLMKQLFAVSHNFNMQMQPQLILLQKTMVTVEGICSSLDNKINVWNVIEPWVAQWAKENFSIHKRISNSYQRSLDLVHEINCIVQKTLDSNQKTQIKNNDYIKYLYIGIGIAISALFCYIQ